MKTTPNAENSDKKEPNRLYVGLNPSELEANADAGFENYEQSFEEEKGEFERTDIETEPSLREKGTIDRADRHQQDDARHQQHNEAPDPAKER